MLKPMKLADVEKQTGVKLSYHEAVTLANPHDVFLRNMAIALSLHSWRNTNSDWLRLQAALVILAYNRKNKNRMR